jgi:hypothetical protein
MVSNPWHPKLASNLRLAHLTAALLILPSVARPLAAEIKPDDLWNAVVVVGQAEVPSCGWVAETTTLFPAEMPGSR